LRRYLVPVVWLALSAIAVVIGLVVENEQFLIIAIQVFMLGALATSWNVLGGFAGQVSLGHAVFFGLGALVTRHLWLAGWPICVALVAAAGVTAVVAAVVGLPMLRLRGIYFAIGTLALGVAVWVTVGNVRPLTTTMPVEQLRAFTYTAPYFLTLGVLAVTVLISVWLRQSKQGLGMMAVRDDEDAAGATGVNALAHKMLAFVVSAAMAALAGGTFAFSTIGYYPSYPFHVEWTFEAILVVFIGGLGTIAGPLVGSAFFVIGRNVLPEGILGFQPVLFGLLFISVVLLLPGGIVEGWQRIFRTRGGPSEGLSAPTREQTGETKGKELV
jgi:branched-chain amino acid transport system permease protein